MARDFLEFVEQRHVGHVGSSRASIGISRHAFLSLSTTIHHRAADHGSYTVWHLSGHLARIVGGLFLVMPPLFQVPWAREAGWRGG
jgi:hypothetical protein